MLATFNIGHLNDAVGRGDLDVVIDLIAKGCPVNPTRSSRMTETPLHLAAIQGNVDIVRELINAGADINARGSISIKGRTPLLLASEKGNTVVVQELLKAGANVDDTDMEGNTPLHLASEKGINDMVQILLKSGAKVYAKNKEKNIPLHCASEKGNYLVVHELLQSFADLYAKNKDGKNSLDIATGSAEQYLLALKEKDFPREIFTLGPQAVLEFAKARQKGSYRSNIIRCMVVGHSGVGKTTLVRKLMNKTACDISSTNGIEVHIGKCYFDKVTQTWITKEYTKHTELILGLENIVQTHFWDFGGQLIFYTTHQSYLSRRGLYLLVFDLSMGLRGEVQDQDLDPVGMKKKKVIDYLEFWIGSIRLYGKSTNNGFPKIVLIGTHIDKVQCSVLSNSTHLQDIRKEINEKFKSVVASGQLIVNEDLFLNAKDLSEDKLNFLKGTILHEGQSYPEYDERIPASWMEIHGILQMLRRDGQKTIHLTRLRDTLSEKNIAVEKGELQVCLLFFHTVGYCVFFKDDILREQVILDAGWIIDAMKSIITHDRFIDRIWRPFQWTRMRNDGIVKRQHVKDLWNRSGKDFSNNCDHLFLVMEKLDLISKPKVYDRNGQDFQSQYYCVPAMLKSDVPRDIQICSDAQKAIVVTFTYDEVLPLAVYNRLVASCLTLWEVYNNHIYNGMVILRSGQFHLIKIQKEFLKVVLSISLVPHAENSLINGNLCRAIIQFVEQTMTGILNTYVIDTEEKKRNFTVSFNDVAKENNLHSEETQQAPDCPRYCPGPVDESRTTIDDKLLMRISRKCRAEYLMPLSANLVGNVQFYADKREEFRELSPSDFAFLIFQEWKCIQLRKHEDVTVGRLVKLLSDADVDVHIICQALWNKGEDDSFLSPIVRQMEVYDEFIDAVADQMSATYLQIGIELGFNLGEIKQMRVSNQCSAPKIVREMLRIWFKRNASRDDKLIGSLASVLLHAQENIAVLMDIEGKAVMQHLSRKRQESDWCVVL